MSLFCLLWTPLFYLFWRSLLRPEQRPGGQNEGFGGVWALLMGGVVALSQFFLGSLVNPGGFGLSRWFSALVDVVSLPAVIPLGVYFVLVSVRRPQNARAGAKALYPAFTNFALLWLIPGAAIRAVSWSALSDPCLLVLVPLLWTALVVGIPLFFGFTGEGFHPAGVLGVLGLPLIAAAAYWAFFSQKNILGFILTGITLVPLISPVLGLKGKNSLPRDPRDRSGRRLY